MNNLLQDGATWLGGQLQATAGISVQYVRRNSCAIVTAWPAMQEYDVIDEDGIPTRLLSYDWSFVAAELVLDGERIEPRPGDLVVQCVDGGELEFEAMPLGKKPCFERLDVFGRMALVHTKRSR